MRAKTTHNRFYNRVNARPAAPTPGSAEDSKPIAQLLKENGNKGLTKITEKNTFFVKNPKAKKQEAVAEETLAPTEEKKD